MSKTKVKVTVRSGKPSNGGTLLASVPVTIAKTDKPKGQFMYQTKAKVLVRIRTTANGQPRLQTRRY